MTGRIQPNPPRGPSFDQARNLTQEPRAASQAEVQRSSQAAINSVQPRQSQPAAAPEPPVEADTSSPKPTSLESPVQLSEHDLLELNNLALAERVAHLNQRLSLELQAQELEEATARLEADRAIEARLSPLSVEDLFLRGSVTQDVVLSEAPRILVRLRSSTTALTDLLTELALTLMKEKHGPLVQPSVELYTGTLQVLTVAAYLEEVVVGSTRTVLPFPASRLHELIRGGSRRPTEKERQEHLDKVREALRENFWHLSTDTPYETTAEIYRQVMRLQARLRSLMTTAGRGELVKKS